MESAADLGQTYMGQKERDMVSWLRSALRLPGYTASLWTEEHDSAAFMFVTSPEMVKMVAYMTVEKELQLVTPHSVLPVAPRTFQYFVKREAGGGEGGAYAPLSMDTIRSRVQMGFVNGGGVDSLLRLMSDVYMPSLRGPGAAAAASSSSSSSGGSAASSGATASWPESLRKEFVGQAQRFMASLVETHHQVHGATVLYVAPDEDLAPGLQDAELIQRLEASLIHWTRQIKEVLASADAVSSDGASAKDSGGPLDELTFYTSRVRDLGGITEQLHSPRLLAIVGLLTEAGSAYLPAFADLSQAIRSAAEEAGDNLKFLGILKPTCEALAAASPGDIPALLPEVLARVRVISAISRFYCSEERVTALLRRVSSEVIRVCAAAIDVRGVFEGDPGAARASISTCSTAFAAWRRLFADTVAAVAASPFGATPRGAVWARLDSSAIFAQVEAFAQRCADLEAVCEAQAQYARKGEGKEGAGAGAGAAPLPPLGGLRGVEHTRSLSTVEATFGSHMGGLRALEGSALDVKVFAWGEASARVRAGIKDLENMYGGIIREAFLDCAAVGAACAHLEAFAALAKSPAVLRALEAKAVEVFALFSRALGDTKAHFEALAPAPPLPDGAPRYAGAAAWSRGLQQRCAQEWRLLEAVLVFLPPLKAAEEARESWKRLSDGLEEYQRNKYSEWITSVADLDANKVLQRLQVPLFRRCARAEGEEEGGSGEGSGGAGGKEGSGSAAAAAPALVGGGGGGGGVGGSGAAAGSSEAPAPKAAKPSSSSTLFLCSNFDQRLLLLVGEVEQWEQLGGKFEVPFFASDLARTQGEHLRSLRSLVLLAAGDYNALVGCQDEVERRLFSDSIKRLDRKIQAGFVAGKVTWVVKSVKDLYLRDMRKCVGEVWAVVQEFKRERLRLAGLISSFRATPLLHLEPNYVHDEGVFEDRQRAHRERARAALRATHADMAALLTKCYTIFRGDGVVVQKAWARWLKAIDARVEHALRGLVKASIGELRRAIVGGGEAAGPEPVSSAASVAGGGGGGGGGGGSVAGSSASFAGGGSMAAESKASGDGALGGGLVGVGGEASREVQPIFRVYVTLEGPNISQQPSLASLTSMIQREAGELLTCISVVPHLEFVLPRTIKSYLATEESIRVMALKAAAAEKLGPARRRGSIGMMDEELQPVVASGGGAAAVAAAAAAAFTAAAAAAAAASATSATSAEERKVDLHDTASAQAAAAAAGRASFYDLIAASPALTDSLRAIVEGVAEQGQQVDSRCQDDFRKRTDKLIGDKGAFVHRFAKSHYTLPALKAQLEDFVGIESEVMETLQEEQLGFLLVDRTRIKAAISGLCAEWRKAFTDLVSTTSAREVEALTSRMEEGSRLLTAQPSTLEELRRNVKLLADTRRDLGPVFRERFGHLESAYKLLTEFDAPAEDGEVARMAALRGTFADSFEPSLLVGEKLVKAAKEAMKAETTAALAAFSGTVGDLRGVAQDPNDGLPYGAELSSQEAVERLGAWRARMAGLRAREKSLEPALEVFDLPPAEHGALAEAERDIESLEGLWGLARAWEADWDSWKLTSFTALNVPAMEEAAAKIKARLVKMRELKKFGAYGGLERRLGDFLGLLPLIQSLGNPAMRARHWEALVKEVGVAFDPTSEAFTLESMFTMGLGKFSDFIMDLSNRANKELAIEAALADIEGAWKALSLDLVEYKGVYFKIRSTEDLFQTLEDHAVSVSAMKASPFYSAFAPELDKWEKSLSVVSEVVDMQMQLQKKWMYLESIFMASEDIRKMLPEESVLFDDVNAKYSAVMGRCVAIKNALQCCLVPGFLEEQEGMDAKLEKIQKALDSYLETKRQQFPRFYFLSNDDLLEILGQSKDPMQVQKHIKKCFEGIQTLTINEPGTAGNACHEAVGMNAPDGERVAFERKVLVRGAVEEWLIEVERAMILALAKIMGIEEWHGTKEGCFFKAKKNKADPEKLKWIKEFPGQLLITAGMMHFVKNCEDALRNKEAPVRQLKKRKKWQVELLIKLAEIVRDKLDKVSRKKVVALITMEIHARDVMDRMIKAHCDSVEDFEWLSQLRIEPVSARTEEMPYGTLAAKQTKSTLEFGFEYQGNNGRLVVTPLTDRCVLTLTTALYMQRGGAPAGPAGTGKTETVKDLGKNLAKFVVVFNCSDGLDFKSVGRMFSGLVQSGGWGCFDEFNRIEVEVLSVIAQQVLSVMEAIRSRKRVFDFMGLSIKCNWQCGIFITMNPGYAGRSELPDNLKSLFRPVAMMVPDLVLIAEVMLQSEGFENSRPLAKKTVTLYNLMIQQLSKQDHYDYSLRSLRGVLVCAGALKRSPTPPAGAPADPKLLEDFIVLRAIRDMNSPKFIKSDSELFRLLLKDLFPALDLPAFDPGELGRAVEGELAKAGLQFSQVILQKCIELRDSKVTRHCNMLVGKSLAGKSTTWKMLAGACSVLAGEKVEGFLRVRVESINPKAITMNELYGAYDLQTMEWADGVLSSVFRGFARDDRVEEKWLMLDGPVDTLWIESMNTVMDDNKTLTLINGDRIGMSETMSLLFECQDLAVASPATVSRAGMIYLDEADLGWGLFVATWMARTFKGEPASTPELLGGLFTKYCARLLRFKRKECKELVPMGDFHAIVNLCNLLESLWADAANELKGAAGEDKAAAAYIERWFAFALTWSLGGVLVEEGRKKFNEALREAAALEGGGSLYPPGGSVYDFLVDPRSREFRQWGDKLASGWQPERGMAFNKIIVPTIDTKRNTFLMSQYVLRGYHFLAVGNTGTGKTALALEYTDRLPKEAYVRTTMYFSSATSSTAVQEIIEGCLEKKNKNKMGPPAGKRLVLLVDDLNMPKKDTFGSQPPLELIRQQMDYGGWYDRGKQAWRFIADMQVLSAMGPPGGGRTQISERLQSRFAMVNFTFPAEREVKKIFETILSSRLGEFGEEVVRAIPGVVAATLRVYEATVAAFLPTPTCSHYLFNLRDIANVCKGLLSLHPKDCEGRDGLLLAWSHECMRTFADRFVSMEDVRKFYGILDTCLHQSADVYVKSLWESCEAPAQGPVFCDFLGTAAPVVPAEGGEERPPYGEARGSLEAIKLAVEEEVLEYNSTPGYLPLNLVFFRDALRHVARIHRILRSPRGNALLVGVGGSGRQSLTRVAAFLTKDGAGNRMGVFSIEITKLYRMLEFHEDLKRLYNRTGVEGKPTCFLFSDTQIKDEGFLEDINNVLNCGEVPNLFTKDERGALIDAMRPVAKKASLFMGSGGGTADELWGLFIERVRANLHVVLAMSPVGASFRNRCRMYPSLVNCTTIDWFLEWPSDALREVATKFLDDVRLTPPKLQLFGGEEDKPLVGGGGSSAAAAPHPPPHAAAAAATAAAGHHHSAHHAAGGVAADPEGPLKSRVATVFAELHLSVIGASRRMLLQMKRHNYVTPTNYLELVKGYRELVSSKLKELGDQRDKLANGLSKLESSKVQVEEMQVDLAKKQKVVEVSSAECDALLVRIVQEKRTADEQKSAVMETSVKIDAEAAKCKAIAADANADLAEALPALDAATEAVDKLDKASITEVKNFANPPAAVAVCLNGVLTLMKRPLGWDEAKKKMNEGDFLRQVKEFDKDNVPEAVSKKLRKITELRKGVAGSEMDFTVEAITKVSTAAGALAAWVLAVEKYSEVAKTVAPKRAILSAAEKTLEVKMAALNKAKAELAEVVAKVDALNAKHMASVAEKTRLTDEAAFLQDKLERAEKLIGGLSGERVRWEASIHRYEKLLTAVPGDSLIAAGFLSYAGPFDTGYRHALVAEWLAKVKENQVLASEDFNFANFLADPADVRDWNIQGLPSDQFSTENGVIVTRGRRWPLMVDPQGQANKWVKEKEKKRGIKVTDLKAKDFLRELEGAITYGLPYLLQDVEEELDPALEPVLTKSIIKRGTRETLKLGDKELDYNPGFRLYMTTKLANPHYTPEVSTKATIVNFAVKEQGLEAQLLGAVVREEEPMLEQEKSRLVLSVAAGKRKLTELENTILRLLSEVKGSLLDDAEIVGVLQASKTTSEEVTASLVVAEATEKKIDAAREGYRAVATRASLLYFVLNDLALVDSMYQFSLDAYNLLFLQSIRESRALKHKLGTEAFSEEAGKDLALVKRIADINEHHSLEVYKYACRGLFERHKLLLSFQICIRKQQVEGGKAGHGAHAHGGAHGGAHAHGAHGHSSVNHAVYDWFLKGPNVLDRLGQRHNPAPAWITPTTWDAITDLEKVEAFSGLAGGVEGAVEEWGAWYFAPAPERMPLPGEWEARCDDLMRLTLLRAMRPDRVLAGAARYVSANLGPAFVEPPPFDLQAIYATSSSATPLVFVLSPGVDPTTEVLQLAASLGQGLEYCSLGQGQAPIAERMLTSALRSGGWVFLQNCHLSISWMPALEKIIDAFCVAAALGGASAPHKNFRLWLSSSPHPSFPIAILQRSIKITTEPPRGIRANIIRLYNLLDEDTFAARSSGAPGTYAKLMYSLSWFHALLLERKKFKSLGWCIAYDFNNSDFLLAADILNDYLAVAPPAAAAGAGAGAGKAAAAAAGALPPTERKTPWDAIRYLVAEVTYGGRVTDDYDRRLVNTYTLQYFSEEVLTTPYYKLSSLPDYYIPDDGTVGSYKDFASQMAQADPPEAFGQHPNADIQSAILDTADLLGTVLSLQPRAIAGEGARPEDKVAATCQDLERQLPVLFDVEAIIAAVSPRADPEPLKVVLYQESERYNILLRKMKTTLAALIKGIAGTVVITPELEQLFDALLVGRVPSAWGFAYPSLKPLGLWMRDLLDRLKQLAMWAERGMPACFWLSGFTYPTGMLTAMLQTSARANGLAIDNLEFEYPILQQSPEHLREGPKEGQYIRGLFLEGAQWNRPDGCLMEPEPMQLFAPMPVVHFKPIEARRERTKGIYKCPMYLYPVRTGTRERPSYMGVVDLKCAEGVEPSQWVKRGTALLLALAS